MLWGIFGEKFLDGCCVNSGGGGEEKRVIFKIDFFVVIVFDVF